MAQDATGTPTSLGIPKFNTAGDAPSGKGSNAQMDSIDALIANRITKPGSPSTNQALVWNGSTWVAAALVDANIAAGAAIAGTKLASASVTGTQIASAVALAGAPTTTTAAVDDNTTKIATTGYVVGQAAAAIPLATNISTGVVGTSTRFARADHVHPTSSVIYDPTGAASRLNPWPLGVIMNSGDINLPGTTALGDSVFYDLIQGGMAAGDVSNDRDMFFIDSDGLAAGTGTIQWRANWNFTQSGGAQGSSARQATLQYRLWNMNTGGVTAAANFTGAAGLSYTDSNGVKTFDSGWNTAGVTSGQHGISFVVQSSRTGGVARDITKILIYMQVRVV